MEGSSHGAKMSQPQTDQVRLGQRTSKGARLVQEQHPSGSHYLPRSF